MEGLSKNNNEIKEVNKIESLDSIVSEQPEIIKKEIKTETLEERENLLNSKRNEILGMFDDKKENNSEDKKRIKYGVDFVFKQNPELEKIGTKEQYSEYLETIFPESKVRNILYHGGSENLKEDNFKFDIRRRNVSIGKLLQYWGAYFTETPGYAQYHAERNFKKNATVAVKINSTNPREILDNKKTFINPFKFSHESISTRKYKKLLADGFDSIIVRYNYNDPKNDIEIGEIKEFIALKSEQIHILGSKQDSENFKKFTENYQDSQG